MTGTIRKALNNRYKLFKKAKTLGNNAFAWKKIQKDADHLYKNNSRIQSKVLEAGIPECRQF